MLSTELKRQPKRKHTFLICLIPWLTFPVTTIPVFGQNTVAEVEIDRNTNAAWDYRALDRIRKPPLGLPNSLSKTQYPITPNHIKLGRKLFFDPRLSISNQTSCATCHVPQEAFTQNRVPSAKGRDGFSLRRNTPSLLNSAFYERLFLDGRETALETLIISPLTHPNEMANPSVGWLLDKLNGLEDYQPLFDRLFGMRSPTISDIGGALGAFQRSLLSANSRFDRWYFGGGSNLLSPEEIRGFDLFQGKADCQSCHQIGKDAALFTDQAFHDTGLKRRMTVNQGQSGHADFGRFEVTGDELDKWRFRTPGLRNIELTAPYMHDGSLETLDDVLNFYNQGGDGAPHTGQDVRIRPLHLSNSEIAAIISFLKTLTGDNIDELSRSSQKISDD